MCLKELRRHLLSHNGSHVVRRMQEFGFEDPVGLIIEMTDDIGKQLTYTAPEAQGMPRHGIPELIAPCCKIATILTFKCVVSFETATRILAITYTYAIALQNLTASRKSNVHWFVVVGDGGNSYAQVSIMAATICFETLLARIEEDSAYLTFRTLSPYRFRYLATVSDFFASASSTVPSLRVSRIVTLMNFALPATLSIFVGFCLLRTLF